MVARNDDGPTGPSTPAQDLVARLFATWRSLLWRAGRRLVERPPAGSGERPTLARLAPYLVGGACLLAGALIGMAIPSEPLARRAATMAALSTVVWAFGRLLVLDLALHNDIEGPALRRAWAWGLVPYLMAVMPTLTLGSWALSGLLTWWLLLKSGVPGRDANRGVLVAWGVQALFAAVAWIAVNGWVAFLAS